MGFGNVNLQQGMSSDFELCFYFTGTDWLADEVKTAVCFNEGDVGGEGGGGGNGTSFFSNYPCTDLVVTRDGADVTAQSSSKGFGCDNPDDPADQTDVQTARSIMFEFEDITCMEVKFESQGDVKTSSGRNFLFAGAAFECECT